MCMFGMERLDGAVDDDKLRVERFMKGTNNVHMRLVFFALNEVGFITKDGVIHDLGENLRVADSFGVDVSNGFPKGKSSEGEVIGGGQSPVHDTDI